MALTCGFFNSLAGDRKYNAEHMSSIFDGIINDGVFQSIGNKLTTIAGNGMEVVVQSGKAWFLHTWTLNDANYPLTIEASDPTLKRIDAVVLEVNHNTDVRTNSLKIIKGAFAESPQKPTLTSTSIVKQVALAYVTINAGVKSITSSDIEVNVGKDACPYVTGIVQVTSISSLYSQWDAEFHKDLSKWQSDFTTWFNEIKEVLSEKVVTNLQNEINTNKENITALQTSVGQKVDILNKASGIDIIYGIDDNKWTTPYSVKVAIDNILQTGSFGKIQMVSYTGDGTWGSSSPRIIPVAFMPKFLIFNYATYNGIFGPIMYPTISSGAVTFKYDGDKSRAHFLVSNGPNDGLHESSIFYTNNFPTEYTCGETVDKKGLYRILVATSDNNINHPLEYNEVNHITWGAANNMAISEAYGNYSASYGFTEYGRLRRYVKWVANTLYVYSDFTTEYCYPPQGVETDTSDGYTSNAIGAHQFNSSGVCYYVLALG